jgi:hypothetical protein
MDVTAKFSDGTEFKTEKNYMTQATNCRDNEMRFGAQWKAQYIRDTSFQPFMTKDETVEIPLPKGVRKATVTVKYFYEINNPGNKVEFFSQTQEVSLDR